MFDASGDAAFSFIDITYIKRTSTKDSFIVEMGLLGPIDSLTYDSVNAIQGIEYSYLIRFYLDGGNTIVNSLTITVTSLKEPGDLQKTGALPDFATIEAGITKPAPPPGLIKTDSVPVSATMVDNNKLIFTIDKRRQIDLMKLSVDTPLNAQSLFETAGTFYSDSAPNDLHSTN